MGDGRPSLLALMYNNVDLTPPAVNGLRYLARRGWEGRVVTATHVPPTGITYPPEIRPHRVRRRGLHPALAYPWFCGMALLAGTWRPALVMAHNAHALLPAWLIARAHRVPLVYQNHEFVDAGECLSSRARLVRWVERRLARRAVLVILPDRERAEIVRTQLRLTRAPVVVANAPPFRPRMGGDALRAALAARGMRFERIVFRHGVVGPGHGIDATIRSMPHWQSERWGFVLMGPGPAEARMRFQALARSLGVERRFVILPPAPYDSVPEFVAGADVGHALYEPVGVNWRTNTTASNKLLEFLAGGVPVLAADYPATARLLREYGCGVTAPPEDPVAIAAAVNTLLTNEEHRMAMARAAYRLHARELHFERQFAPVAEAMARLVNPR